LDRFDALRDLPRLTAPATFSAVNLEIINTGSELLLGRVLNTHQQWLCRQFADHGYTVNRLVVVDDSGPAIQQAIGEAADHADLILVTGGLGPTSDDRTRDLVAQWLGRALIEDAAIVAHLEQFFAARQRVMPARVRVQALVPAGATVLNNAFGTAPGLVMDLPPRPGATRPGVLVMLPGPPRELRPMFSTQVLPLVQARFPLGEPFVCRTLRTTGVPESQVEEKIAGPLQALTDAGLELGYCARPGEVDVRFVARGPEASVQVAHAERVTRELLGCAVFGADDDLLETVLVRLLTERRHTLALAESCTGGLIAHRVTNVPGASAVLLAGWVTYSNAAKQSCLGVPPETLAVHGAVSEPVARAMAEGARSRAGADYAVAVTGIAGPSGGTPDKPVGTVFLALATPTRTLAVRRINPWERETFKHVTSQQALDLVRLNLEG
jgi:nicotinamide-nucleotide amidase